MTLEDELMGKAAKVNNIARIFYNNYNDMNEANTKNGDKYFHGLANCESVQQGGLVAPILFDVVKEGYDLLKKII